MTPACAQCGATGWSITVGGVPAAPMHLRIIGPLSADELDFCDERCLLQWCIGRREMIVEGLYRQLNRSGGDVNALLHASFWDRVFFSRRRTWRRLFDERKAARA